MSEHEALRDRATIHISLSDEATSDDAEGFFDALADWMADWMEAHPDRGQWDPFLSMHAESCDDSDHCHGPGSVVEREILARVEAQS